MKASATSSACEEDRRMNPLRAIAVGAIASLSAVWALAVNAQTYPERPIRVIVPIAAGSVTDAAPRPTSCDREQRRRQRHPRSAGLRASGARRLYALSGLPQHALDQSAAVQPAAIRPGAGLHADHQSLSAGRGAVCEQLAQRQYGNRPQGLCAGASVGAQLRDAWARL